MRRMAQVAAAAALGILAALGLGVAPAVADTVAVTLSSRAAAAGSIVYLTAVVSPSPIGGEVRFDSDQGVLATAPVIFGKAETWIVPQVSGTITVTATYASFDGGTKGTSAPLVITVGGGSVGAVSLDLAVDASPTVGKPATVTATVSPSTGLGRVTFSIDGAKLSTVEVTRGQASTTWKPATAGQHTISARYSGASVEDAVASRSVSVAPAGGSGVGRADVIVIDPAGELTPWTPSAPVTLANGTKRQLVATSSSGAAVTLAVAGPCSLSNNVLSTEAGSNTCTLVAASPGGNGFVAATQNYGIVLVPGVQQADIQAPPSGRVARKSSFPLGPAGQATNLGKPVTWMVASGSTSACRVVRSSRAVRLNTGGRAGSCIVRARADGIPTQWKAFKATRAYRVR